MDRGIVQAAKAVLKRGPFLLIYTFIDDILMAKRRLFCTFDELELAITALPQKKAPVLLNNELFLEPCEKSW